MVGGGIGNLARSPKKAIVWTHLSLSDVTMHNCENKYKITINIDKLVKQKCIEL